MRRRTAEISNAYFLPDGAADPPKSSDETSLADRFESVIDLQDVDGYDLESWRLTSASTDQVLTETIVAVFKQRPK